MRRCCRSRREIAGRGLDSVEMIDDDHRIEQELHSARSHSSRSRTCHARASPWSHRPAVRERGGQRGEVAAFFTDAVTMHGLAQQFGRGQSTPARFPIEPRLVVWFQVDARFGRGRTISNCRCLDIPLRRIAGGQHARCLRRGASGKRHFAWRFPALRDLPIVGAEGFPPTAALHTTLQRRFT